MPETIPTKLPRWATDAAADITEPPEATKDTGWNPGIKPPAGFVDWFWNLVYLWIQHLSGVSAFFDDLATAADATSEGDMCIVFEDDTDTGPGIELTNINSGANGPEGGIDACGNLVVFCSGAIDARAVDRDLVSVVTYVKTNAGQNIVIKTDGTTTVLGYGDFVEAFNATTGASLWVFDRNEPVHDLVLTHDGVYVVGEITTLGGDVAADRHLHRLNLVTGAVIWDYQHSATASSEVRSVTSNGRQVFIAGDASSFASLATLRAIRSSDGFDVAGEGGNGTEDGTITWDDVQVTVSTNGQLLDCDRERLYVGNIAGAAQQVQIRSPADGQIRTSLIHPDGSLSAFHLMVEDRYLVLSMSDQAATPEGFVEVRDKRTLALAWRYGNIDSSPTPDHVAPIASTSDGQRVYVIGDGISKVWSLARGNTPRRYRRVDQDAEINTPYSRWLLIPEE